MQAGNPEVEKEEPKVVGPISLRPSIDQTTSQAATQEVGGGSRQHNSNYSRNNNDSNLHQQHQPSRDSRSYSTNNSNNSDPNPAAAGSSSFEGTQIDSQHQDQHQQSIGGALSLNLVLSRQQHQAQQQQSSSSSPAAASENKPITTNNSASDQSHRIKVTLTSAPRESIASCSLLNEQQVNSPAELIKRQSTATLISANGIESGNGSQNLHSSNFAEQATNSAVSGSYVAPCVPVPLQQTAPSSSNSNSNSRRQVGGGNNQQSEQDTTNERRKNQEDQLRRIASQRINRNSNLQQQQQQRQQQQQTSNSRVASQNRDSSSGRSSNQLIKSSSQAIGLSQSPSTNLLIEKQAQQNQQQANQTNQLHLQPNPKQLAIYINGKIRSNSIFCHSTPGSSLTNSILNKFHITGTGSSASAAATGQHQQTDQVAGSGGGRDQGANSSSSWSLVGLKGESRGKSSPSASASGANKRVIPGIYIDDKQSPLKRTKLRSGAGEKSSRSCDDTTATATEKSYTHYLVSNFCSGAQRILQVSCACGSDVRSSPKEGAKRESDTTSQSNQELERDTGADKDRNNSTATAATNATDERKRESSAKRNRRENSAGQNKTRNQVKQKKGKGEGGRGGETKIEITQVSTDGQELHQEEEAGNLKFRGGKQNSLDSGAKSPSSSLSSSLQDYKENQERAENQEDDPVDSFKIKGFGSNLTPPTTEQVVTQKTSYKLNPSSMFLRKAMRYYRLWIYCANVTIFIGTLIFLLAALYVTSDFRIKLLVTSSSSELSLSSTSDFRQSVGQSAGESADNQNHNQGDENPALGSENNFNFNINDNNDYDEDLLFGGNRKSSSRNQRHRDFYHDIGVSYSEPSLVLAYIVIAIQAGILQAIGCLGAIRMKERLIQTFWYLILALTFVDVLFLMYWLNRYDFITKSLRHHLTTRLTYDYGHLATILPPEESFIDQQTNDAAHLSMPSSNATNSSVHQNKSKKFNQNNHQQSPHHVQSVASEFSYKLDKILTDIIDKIQAESQCCGITDAIDYERSSWRRLQLSGLEMRLNLSSSERNEFDELLRQVPLVPASCCRRSHKSNFPSAVTKSGSSTFATGSGNQNKSGRRKTSSRKTSTDRKTAARDKSSGSSLPANQLIDQRHQQQQGSGYSWPANQPAPNILSSQVTTSTTDQEDSGEPEFSNPHRQVLEADNPMSPIMTSASDTNDDDDNNNIIRDFAKSSSGDESIPEQQLRDAISTDDNLSAGGLYDPKLKAATLSHAFKAEEHDEFAWLSKGKRRLLAKQDNYNLWLRDMVQSSGSNSNSGSDKSGSSEGAEPAIATDEIDETVEANGASSRLRRWVVESMVDNKQRVLSRLVELVSSSSSINGKNAKSGSSVSLDKPPGHNEIGSPPTLPLQTADQLASDWAKLAALRRLLFVNTSPDINESSSANEKEEKLITRQGSDDGDGGDRDDEFSESKFRWPNELELNFDQYKLMESYLLTNGTTAQLADSSEETAGPVQKPDVDSNLIASSPKTSSCCRGVERLMATNENSERLSLDSSESNLVDPPTLPVIKEPGERNGIEQRPRRSANMDDNNTNNNNNPDNQESSSRDRRRMRLLGKLYEIIKSERELGCSPRSYFDQATIYTQGCHLYIKSWLDSSWNILFVTGLCVLTTLKICSLVLLRLEIREMIHKIRVLKGMATEYNALHDLEAYLPRHSVCAQAAELTPTGVAAAIPSPTAAASGMIAPTGGSSSGVGVLPSLPPHRLGGSFSEAVVAAATAAAVSGASSNQGGSQLGFTKGSLSSADRAASMKAVASAMSTMLTPSMCTRSSSASTAHLHAAASSLLGAQKQALSLRSDLFPTISRRHTAISVCPAAAAAAAAAAHHLMSRRGTYVANPIYSPQFTFGGDGATNTNAAAAAAGTGSYGLLGKRGQIASSMCGIGPNFHSLAQHRHSAHTVHSLYSQQLFQPQQQQHLSTSGAASASVSSARDRSAQQAYSSSSSSNQQTTSNHLRSSSITNTGNLRNFLGDHQINSNTNNQNHNFQKNNNATGSSASTNNSRRPSVIAHQSSGDSQHQGQAMPPQHAGHQQHQVAEVGATTPKATTGTGQPQQRPQLQNIANSGCGNRSPSAGSSHQLLSLVYPFKRQSSGGAQSAGNFSLDLSPALLTESRRSIH